MGLGPATDARPTHVIASYQINAWPTGWPPTYYEVSIGAELAKYANDVLANCLTAKGYCVQRDPHSLLVSGRGRLVGTVLLSADTKNKSSWITGAPLFRNRVAEIKVEVRDSSSQIALFVGNYSSFNAIDFGMFGIFADLDAPYLEEVNKAIDDAVKKACDDPAFIAAIAPPQPTVPSSPAQPVLQPRNEAHEAQAVAP